MLAAMAIPMTPEQLAGMRSDIDLAASGLGAAYFAALGSLLSLSPDFEFDLVDLDACPQGLRDAVFSRGVPL